MSLLMWWVAYFLFGIATHEAAKFFLLQKGVLTREQIDAKDTWLRWVIAGAFWPFIILHSLWHIFFK